MDAPWRIELLGWLRAVRGEQVISRYRRKKIGSLLAFLAHYAHRSHPRDVLIDLFWPEADLDAGRRDLRVALSSLRSQLEPPGVPPGAVILTDRNGVQLNPAACVVDVAEFETAVRRAERAESDAERLQALEEVVSLYQGELLPGYYEEWILPERVRLSDAFHQALEQGIGLLADRGELPRAQSWARRAVSADPLREEPRRELIRLLAASGQPEVALQEYADLERLLEQELDATPEVATRALVEEIRETGAGSTQHAARSAQLKRAADREPRRPSVRCRPSGSELGVARSVLPASVSLPTGTVTFLMTDIEGHTALWERAGETFTAVLKSHDLLLREQFHRHGGYEVKKLGDGFLVAFQSAYDAITCAIAGQSALSRHPWPEAVGPLRVRMALRTGEAQVRDGDYQSLVINLASRMLAAANGGQILCSEETAGLVRRDREPGVRLTDLGVYRLRQVQQVERLFQVDGPDLPQQTFPPLRAELGHGDRLPLQFTRFFGRREEIAALRDLCLEGAGAKGDAAMWPSAGRLVTLTGPGGTGKTRLALAVGAELQDALRGAVWLVRLEDLTDPHRIPQQIRDALHLPAEPGSEPLAQVAAALEQQPALLILDNMEHLVREGAAIIQRLRESVRALTLLVTSRQRLGLPGEQEFPLSPLPVPHGETHPERLLDYESVRLFVDRAQAARVDFQLNARNAQAVAALCERLEGLPLAIELAAARAGVLTPAQMLARLEQRFGLLTRTGQQGPERHRSLRAVLDASYQLLSSELQRFFAGLSLFRGGWTLEAAEAICVEGLLAQPVMALEYLEQLRECSLVIAEEVVFQTRTPEESWQAESASAGGEEIRFRMLETLREYAAEQLTSAECGTLARRHTDFFLRLAEEAERELWGPTQRESLDRLEREHENLRAALSWSRAQGEAEIGLRLCGALGLFWDVRGHLAEGRERLAGLLSLPGARAATRAKALSTAGSLAWSHGDFEGAWSLTREALEIWRTVCDKRGIASSLNRLGVLARDQRDFERAVAFHQEGLSIRRELGDKHGIAQSVNNLGNVARDQGDYEGARSFYLESLAIRRELDNKYGIADSLDDLGVVARYQGDYARARTLCQESLAIRRELGDKRGIALSLANLGRVARYQGDYAEARTLYQEALELNRERGNRTWEADNLRNLGSVAQDQGDYARARSFYQKSLAIFQQLGDAPSVLVSLERFASLAVAEGLAERAVRLLGALTVFWRASGTTREPHEEGEVERLAAAARATLCKRTFEAAWVEGRVMALGQAIAEVLAEPANV